jgi:hypothetical protein
MDKFIKNEPIYYILCNFNKLKLDNSDINQLIKLGYCQCCIKTLKDKILTKEEIKYIENKDWDNFIDKYPLKLNHCNCTRCNCGLNRLFEVMYDLFDIDNKIPICWLSCIQCNSYTKLNVNKKKSLKRSYSDIENINNSNNELNNNCNKKKHHDNVKLYNKQENITTNIEITNNNQLICN